jgi:hypothetical protein
MTNKTKNIDLTFLLKINVESLNKKKFSDIGESNQENNFYFSEKKEYSNLNFTNIEDILTNDALKEEKADIFFEKNDDIITMLEYVKGENSEKSVIKCFWCRHSFDTDKISCPINYNNNQLEKNYYSEITKDRYVIKENIDNDKYDCTLKKLKDINSKNKGINLVKKDFYMSDGVFCSYNCCLAFINDNKHNCFYSNSKSLLLNIYRNLYGKDKKLFPAPSWRLLKDYGGNATIEQFRECFNNVNYTEINKITEKIDSSFVSKSNTPVFKPFGIFYTCSIISNNSY